VFLADTQFLNNQPMAEKILFPLACGSISACAVSRNLAPAEKGTLVKSVLYDNLPCSAVS
jgi:hypothetical protein